MIVGKVKLQLSRTADGKGQYLQIMSQDMVSLNIVLVADQFEVKDDRPKGDLKK